MGFEQKLMQKVITKGNVIQREWEGQEISVYMYIFTYDMGVIFLFVNYSNFPYEENLHLELSSRLI